VEKGERGEGRERDKVKKVRAMVRIGFGRQAGYEVAP
jgi:hypothetical protein